MHLVDSCTQSNHNQMCVCMYTKHSLMCVCVYIFEYLCVSVCMGLRLVRQLHTVHTYTHIYIHFIHILMNLLERHARGIVSSGPYIFTRTHILIHFIHTKCIPRNVLQCHARSIVSSGPYIATWWRESFTLEGCECDAFQRTYWHFFSVKLCVCMYVCMHVCMYLCMYGVECDAFSRPHWHFCSVMYVYVMYVYVCMHVCIYTCMALRAAPKLYVCVYVCMHVCMWV